jgi:hypothetical protein
MLAHYFFITIAVSAFAVGVLYCVSLDSYLRSLNTHTLPTFSSGRLAISRPFFDFYLIILPPSFPFYE